MFIDYIAENLKFTMGDFYKIEMSHRIKFKSAASKSLIALIREIENKVGEEDPYLVIENICKHYMTLMRVTGGGIFKLDNDMTEDDK